MVLEKCYGEYNPKLDFKMLCNLNKDRSIKESLYKQKSIFEGKTDDVSTPTEIHLKKSVNAYEVIRSKPELTEEDIINAYYAFEEEKVDYSKIKIVVKLINEEIDEYLQSAIRVLSIVIKQNLFNNFSDEMSILLFNYMMLKNDYHPIIFYNTFMTNLTEIIRNGALVESIFRIMEPMIKVSCEYNMIQGKTSSEEVIKVIESIKKILIEKYNIKHAFIFGSLVRGDQTEYSDIDLIFIAEGYSEFTNEEIKIFIKSLFKQRLDIVFISDNQIVKNMTTDFYTHRIKIF